MTLDSTNKEHLIIREILAHQAGLHPWIPFYTQTLVKDSISGLMQLRDTLYSKEYSKEFPIEVAENIYLHHSYPDSIIQQIISSELLDKKEYRYSDLGYYLFEESGPYGITIEEFELESNLNNYDTPESNLQNNFYDLIVIFKLFSRENEEFERLFPFKQRLFSLNTFATGANNVE